jgi:hypothetical protein
MIEIAYSILGVAGIWAAILGITASMSFYREMKRIRKRIEFLERHIGQWHQN